MPHVILEYSDNLNLTDKDIAEFQQNVNQKVHDTGLFPLKGIRSKAYCCTQHCIADGNPKHAFVHLEIKIGIGRTEQEKDRVTKLLLNYLIEFFDSGTQGIAISIQLSELEPIHKYNHNTIGTYL